MEGVGALDAACAKELAIGLRANGASLASLDLSQNEIPAEQMDPIKALCESKQIALKAAPQQVPVEP